MPFCLLPNKLKDFKDAIISGKLDFVKLNEATSSERIKMLEDYVGKENAKEANLMIERKMLLKNAEAGVARAIKDMLGLSEADKKALKDKSLAEMQRKKDLMFSDEGHLDSVVEDIYSRKYKTDITAEEAKNIYELTTKTEKLKSSIKEDSPRGSKERLEYGMAKVLMDKYVSGLKLDAKKMPLGEYALPQNWGKAVYNTAGFTKSLMASLDDSFFGTQGAKMMLTRPFQWAKLLGNSFVDIGRQLAAKSEGLFKGYSDAVENSIKAEVFSRPNAINGKYKAMKLDIGMEEEAFPTSLPEKIPLLGRFFKASEIAFKGGSLRMRADYADKMIKIAEKAGKDMTNPEEAEGVGNLINAMTGRASLGRFEPIAKEVNATLFSGKFLASNIHTLTSHLFDRKADAFVKKQAALNLVRIIGGLTSIYTIANALQPGSVDLDPRGSNFGKIKIGNKSYDPTGKMASLAHLGAQAIPSLHNGELGFWSKNSTTGKWTKLDEAGYGARNTLDVVEQFFEGKLSPMAGLLRDIWKGSDFSGNKVTPVSAVKGLVTPLPISTFKNIKDNKDPLAQQLVDNILSGLGITVGISKTVDKNLQIVGGDKKTLKELNDISNASGKKINLSTWDEILPTQKTLTQFKESLSGTEWEDAKKQYNNLLKDKINSALRGDNDAYNEAVTPADKIKVINGLDTEAQKETLDNFGFVYEKAE